MRGAPVYKTQFEKKNATKQKSLFGAGSRSSKPQCFPLMGCRCGNLPMEKALLHGGLCHLLAHEMKTVLYAAHKLLGFCLEDEIRRKKGQRSSLLVQCLHNVPLSLWFHN